MSQGVKYGYGKGSSGQFNQAGITLVDGEQSELQLDAAGRLITNATVTATFVGPQEVIIKNTDDSIAIGTSTQLFTGTNYGPAFGLDVNVLNTIPLSGTVDTNLKGLNAFKVTTYTVGTTAVQLTPSPLVNRSTLIIKVKTTPGSAVWVNNTSGVTVGTSFPLFDGDTLQIDLTPSTTIYVISDAPGQKVYVFEMGA